MFLTVVIDGYIDHMCIRCSTRVIDDRVSDNIHKEKTVIKTIINS